MKKLYIYCAGGFGKEVMDVARRYNANKKKWSSINFLDDSSLDKIKYDANIYKFENFLATGAMLSGEVVIANGEPAVREKLCNLLISNGATLATLVDTSSIVAETSVIEPGVVITPLCSISSDAILKKNSSVNTMSIVGHDVEVGENSVISSMVNIGGASKIGRNCYIGMGALIKESVVIGDNVIIGMGSVVYSDIPDDVIALGNPARPMRPNTNKKVFK